MTANEPTTSLPDLLDELGIARRFTLDLIADLSPDQIDWRPHDNSSAIGWHLGHQAAVAHFMVRNLTAAEPTFNPEFDQLFDSATPEPDRGSLPSLEAILDYRNSIENSTTATLERIINRHVGAPHQLAAVAHVVLRALINHEYQHSAWINEVRDTMIATPVQNPTSRRIISVDGYWMIP
jgi:hypothetical protein